MSANMHTSQSAVLIDALRGIRRRARWLGALHGTGLTLACAVGLLLTTVLLDYVFNLPAVPRALLIVLSAAVLGYVLWTRVARAIFSRLRVSDVAGHLENVFPQFEDRLRSTVNFAEDPIPGSDVMKRRVIDEATRVAEGVELKRALVARPAVLALAGGLAAVLAVGLAGFAFSNYARIALSRLLIVDAPAWPKRVEIELVREIPAKIADGQRLDLRMRLKKGDRAGMKATVAYRYDNGDIRYQTMNRADDGTYSVTIDARGAAMSVWLEAGDDRTEPQRIDVVPRLALSRVEARITPPAYAKLPPVTVNLAESPATVTSGSFLQLVLRFNKPLSDRPVALTGVKEETKVPELSWERPSPELAVASFVADQSLRFRVQAYDTDLFENPGVEEYEIVVRPDQNPTVMIETPRGNEDRTAVTVIRLEAMAEDDFDISSMTLVVDRLGDKKHWEIPLTGWSAVESTGQRRRFRQHYAWELSQLSDAQLKSGDVLEYFVRVTDNYEMNGETHPPVASGRLRINIISQETLSGQITDAMRVVAERVRQAQNAQNRTRQETANLRKDSADKTALDTADRTALSRLSDQQATIAAQTRQLAGRMGELEQRLADNRSDNAELKQIAQTVRESLADTAEDPMSRAAQKLNETVQQSDPRLAPRNEDERQRQQTQRLGSLDESEKQQQRASDQLAGVMEKMGNLGTFEQLLQNVREALTRQQEISRKTAEAGRQTIGRTRKQLTDEQRKQLDELAAEQRRQSQNTEKLTAALNKAAEQISKNDPASSQAMKQAASQAQQQQVSARQAQAAQSAQQNQQAQAQAAQKQAELGLQMMLDTLREAERRKLEQLARELAKMEELINNLVRRQAGHNIDNLVLQDSDASKQLVSDELVAKAGRIRQSMPPAELPQLTRSQIQTETNSRDVAKTAESMPKAVADIAAELTRAAGLMERAIIELKETKLAEAYDPSQVKALAALEEALLRTKQMQAEIQQEMEQANRDSVRQVYEKVRAEQETLNQETLRIDGAPRLDDGSLRREDAVHLGQLPGQQGGLADRIKELQKPLQDLGGVVYVWANNDIVSTMRDVKGELAKPATGKPTQIRQQQIIDQLDAMIRSLAVKPKQSDFHGEPGGGCAGGACKPKLPSEAELRLMKELQLAVNKATKALDAQQEKNKPELVALGNRQGEFRDLLDQLLQRASNGMVKLDPEPDARDRLPEEAGTVEIENQELDDWLRGGRSGDDQVESDIKMVGQRMARSRQRLALDNDPGKTTQLIQERIIFNLDNLIEMARVQQVQAMAKPGSKPGQQAQQVKPGQQNAGQQNTGKRGASSTPGGATAANAANPNATGDNTADTSRDIREQAAEWGSLTPRERQAIIEGTHERTLPKYKKITDDYYEMMSRKASEER